VQVLTEAVATLGAVRRKRKDEYRGWADPPNWGVTRKGTGGCSQRTVVSKMAQGKAKRQRPRLHRREGGGPSWNQKGGPARAKSGAGTSALMKEAGLDNVKNSTILSQKKRRTLRPERRTRIKGEYLGKAKRRRQDDKGD